MTRPKPTPTASLRKYGTVAHPVIGEGWGGGRGGREAERRGDGHRRVLMERVGRHQHRAEIPGQQLGGGVGHVLVAVIAARLQYGRAGDTPLLEVRGAG